MNTHDTNLQHNEPERDELTNDRLLGGHEYDGIRELDNKLPRWWLYLFYVTILFSAIYLLGYHVTNWWPLSGQEYDNEVAAAPQKPANEQITEDLYVVLTDESSLADGKETYTKICVACHGLAGQGLVGPNMTDPYWIHGNNMKMLFEIVLNGAPDKSKGMIAYKDQLSPKKIQDVLSYIFSLQGSDVSAAVPPAKPKEGTYEWNPKTNPEGVSNSEDSAATTGNNPS